MEGCELDTQESQLLTPSSARSQDDQGILRPKDEGRVVRDLLQSLRHCLVPNHMVCSFSMTQEEVPNKAHGFQNSSVYTLCWRGSTSPFPGLSGALSPSPEQPEPGAHRPGCTEVQARSGQCV